MSNNSTTTTYGPSTLGLLGIVFVTLKLLSIISWSWYLVLLPFYVVPLVLLIVFLLTSTAIGIVGVVIALLDKTKNK